MPRTPATLPPNLTNAAGLVDTLVRQLGTPPALQPPPTPQIPCIRNVSPLPPNGNPSLFQDLHTLHQIPVTEIQNLIDGRLSVIRLTELHPLLVRLRERLRHIPSSGNYLQQLFSQISDLLEVWSPPVANGGLNAQHFIEEIAALATIYPPIEITRGLNHRDWVLSITTPPITLSHNNQALPLGRFKVELNLTDIHHAVGINARGSLHLTALEPNFSQTDRDNLGEDACTQSNGGHAHPHMQEHSLCTGAAENVLRTAAREGRLVDFFDTLVSTLSMYNELSPYHHFHNWFPPALTAQPDTTEIHPEVRATYHGLVNTLSRPSPLPLDGQFHNVTSLPRNRFEGIPFGTRLFGSEPGRLAPHEIFVVGPNQSMRADGSLVGNAAPFHRLRFSDPPATEPTTGETWRRARVPNLSSVFPSNRSFIIESVNSTSRTFTYRFTTGTNVPNRPARPFSALTSCIRVRPAVPPPATVPTPPIAAPAPAPDTQNWDRPWNQIISEYEALRRQRREALQAAVRASFPPIEADPTIEPGTIRAVSRSRHSFYNPAQWASAFTQTNVDETAAHIMAAEILPTGTNVSIQTPTPTPTEGPATNDPQPAPATGPALGNDQPDQSHRDD